MSTRFASVWMLWILGLVRADEEPATCQLQVNTSTVDLQMASETHCQYSLRNAGDAHRRGHTRSSLARSLAYRSVSSTANAPAAAPDMR